MTVIHEQFDGDRTPTNEGAFYRSNMQRCEVPCHICGRPLFVGKSTKSEIERAIEHDLGNPLTCSDCERNDDDRDY